MKTEQRLFNEALAHIRKQGKPSIDDDNACLYRSPEGLGCAFAPAIKHYDPDMEDSTANHLLENHKEDLYDWVHDVDTNFALDLQNAHDCNSKAPNFMVEFENSMGYLVDKWGLEYER